MCPSRGISVLRVSFVSLPRDCRLNTILFCRYCKQGKTRVSPTLVYVSRDPRRHYINQWSSVFYVRRAQLIWDAVRQFGAIVHASRTWRRNAILFPHNQERKKVASKSRTRLFFLFSFAQSSWMLHKSTIVALYIQRKQSIPKKCCNFY